MFIMFIMFMFRNELFESDEDVYEPVEVNDSQSLSSNKKWIGCANHNLQLALKILDKEQQFSKIADQIIEILRKIKASPSAHIEFRNRTGRSIVLPIVTRLVFLVSGLSYF